MDVRLAAGDAAAVTRPSCWSRHGDAAPAGPRLRPRLAGFLRAAPRRRAGRAARVHRLELAPAGRAVARAAAGSAGPAAGRAGRRPGPVHRLVSAPPGRETAGPPRWSDARCAGAGTRSGLAGLRQAIRPGRGGADPRVHRLELAPAG